MRLTFIGKDPESNPTGIVASRWMSPERSTGHPPDTFALQPVENFLLVLRYPKPLVKASAEFVALIGCPLNPAALVLGRSIWVTP
jgi:hypothetical protein